MRYADLHDLSEDDRIEQIGRQVMRGQLVGVITDAVPGKPERYVRKMKKRFPRVRLVDQIAGPTANTVLLRFGPPADA